MEVVLALLGHASGGGQKIISYYYLGRVLRIVRTYIVLCPRFYNKGTNRALA